LIHARTQGKWLLAFVGGGEAAAATAVRTRRARLGHATGRRAPDGRVVLLCRYVCLYLITLGTGGLKSSVSGFSIDSLMSVPLYGHFHLLQLLLHKRRHTPRRHLFVYVQYHVGRSWAYSTCTGSMLIAIKSSSQAPGDTATSAAPGVPSCTPSMSSLLAPEAEHEAAAHRLHTAREVRVCRRLLRRVNGAATEQKDLGGS